MILKTLSGYGTKLDDIRWNNDDDTKQEHLAVMVQIPQTCDTIKLSSTSINSTNNNQTQQRIITSPDSKCFKFEIFNFGKSSKCDSTHSIY